MTYSVAVQRRFTAHHFSTGGDWGDENESHAHHYLVEVRFDGPQLDAHGYLVDICDIEPVLDALVVHYRDRTLNGLPEFEGLNPSLEQFAAIVCDAMLKKIDTRRLSTMTARIWENDLAWAACTRAL